MAGLASFIDGFVSGTSTRQAWNDRRRQRKLDEEDRVYQAEERANGREDRTYTIEERRRRRAKEDQAQAEYDRLLAEQAAERQARADSYAASKGGATDPDVPAVPKGRSLLDAGAGGDTALGFGSGVPAMSPVTGPAGGPMPVSMARSLPQDPSQPQYPLLPPAQLGAATQAYLDGLPPTPAAPSAPSVTTNPNLMDLSSAFQSSVAPAGRILPETAPTGTPDPIAAAKDPAAAPSAQIAAATAPEVAPKARLAFGIDAPLTVTPKQEARAVGDFMANYREKGVPFMIDFYMKTGQFEKAQAFQEWVDNEENKQSMKLWAEGVHAAAIGNETKMLDRFSAYYNRFNNGEEIVRKKSGITRDGNGNMTGATITFKDMETGVEHTQTFNGSEDLIQAGLMALSPEKMFEMMMEQQSAANDVSSSSVEFEQSMALAMARAGIKGEKPTSTRVAAIWADLSKNSFGEFDKLPLAERSRQVAEIIAGQDQTAGAVDGYGSTADLPDDYSE
jgi:hypothetical protein